jgi:hypothetical protein
VLVEFAARSVDLIHEVGQPMPPFHLWCTSTNSGSFEGAPAKTLEPSDLDLAWRSRST